MCIFKVEKNMMEFIGSVYFILLYPVLLIGSIILGAYIAYKRYHKKNIVWKPIGLETSVVAIFGLILSFTLNSSNIEYRNRTTNLNAASDAVAQMRRESLFMEPVITQHVKEYLIRYTAIQTRINDNQWSHQMLLDTIATINGDFMDYLLQLQHDSATNKMHVTTLLHYHNNLCTHFYKNAFSYTERTPAIVMALLIIGSLLIGFLIGFSNTFATGYKSYLLPLIYTFLTALAIVAICDMDNPKTGIIKPDTRNIQYMHERLLNSNR